MSQADASTKTVLPSRTVVEHREALAKGKGLDPADRSRLAAITLRAARVRDSRGTRPAY